LVLLLRPRKLEHNNIFVIFEKFTIALLSKTMGIHEKRDYAKAS